MASQASTLVAYRFDLCIRFSVGCVSQESFRANAGYRSGIFARTSMRQSLKEAVKKSVTGSGHRFIGLMLFCLLWLVIVVFCVWFKSWWHEPLGVDGLLLSFVLWGIAYKAIPMIDRLINR
jgi:hypothetical protein